MTKPGAEAIVQRDAAPSRPFKGVRVGIFHVDGKFIMVDIDRLSGWPAVKSMKHLMVTATRAGNMNNDGSLLRY